MTEITPTGSRKASSASDVPPGSRELVSNRREHFPSIKMGYNMFAMRLEEITPDLLKSTLKAFSRTQEPPEGLLGLHCLKQTGSRVERVITLQDCLYTVITEHLAKLRHAESLPNDLELPNSCEAFKLALGRDFSRYNATLEAWSALFHRYVSSVTAAMRLEELATAANITPRQFRRRVTEGIDLLTHWLRRAEMEAHRSLRRLSLRRHLPVANYARLFGVDNLASQVVSVLTEPHGSPMVALDGLGGIGKTTLAIASANRLADTEAFTDILWVSARQERLLPTGEIRPISQPVLTFGDLLSRLAVQVGREELLGFDEAYKESVLYEIFHHTPHLIIVDNLETMEDYRALAPRLRPMAEESRFLFTTRHAMSEFSFVRSFHIPPLPEKASIELLRYELERHGNRDRTPSLASLRQVYQIVGGLPLALKLVAGQLHHLPAEVVLANLRSAQGQAAASLYTFIYRHTWELLDDLSRQLLLDMLTISPDGEDLDWLRLVSGLPDEQLERAIVQLTNLALLQTSGTLEHTYYRLHRLTITFLQTEILGAWQG